MRPVTLLMTVVMTLALAACSSGSPSAAVEVTDRTVIVDVRTPEEFGAGHLDGAELLDLTSGEFAAALPNLDPSVRYLVYCRSGNRSAQAVALMEDAGFTDVTDLGSVQDASEATGIDLVS